MIADELIRRYSAGERDFRDFAVASLWRANLMDANLEGANLAGAYLAGAYLAGAYLAGALFWRAYLMNANLEGANLGDTCLDPMAVGNSDPCGYETYTTRSGHVWCKAYRTREQPVAHGPSYEDSCWYEVSVFSVSDDECHPGLHIYRSVDDMPARWLNRETIAVWIREVDLHVTLHCKHRTRAFWVEGNENA